MDVTTANMAIDVTRIFRAAAGLVTIHQCVLKVRMVILRNYVINVQEEKKLIINCKAYT